MIVLRGGFTARVAAYLLVIRLEAEGFTLSLDRDGHLYVAPPGQLAAADVAALREYQPDVIRLLRYVPDDGYPCSVSGPAVSERRTA